MKKFKYVLVLILVFSLFSVSGCSASDAFNKENSVSADGNTYVIQQSTVQNYTTIGSDEAAMVVASTVMPCVLEITCTVDFSYTAYSYNPWYGYGSSSRTVSSSQTCKATGFVINEDGYVMTNAHVVTIEDADEYTNLQYTGWDIKLNYADTSKTFDATVVAYDVDLDLAILKMDISSIENLQYVTFFNLTDPESDTYNTDAAVKLYYGETAVVVGNANGYGISVTKGVVSAPVRYFKNGDSVTKAIQTDAAINSGNSGGPLCNAYGAVIGINSFKIVSSSTSESLGFAIPAYVILSYIDSVNTAQNAGVKYYVTSERAYVAK